MSTQYSEFLTVPINCKPLSMQIYELTELFWLFQKGVKESDILNEEDSYTYIEFKFELKKRLINVRAPL